MNERTWRRQLVSERLWAELEPLLPAWQPSPKGGRPRVEDRAALEGILYVLHTGTPWEHLPQELGCGSGMTCWRRLRQWQAAGVWQRLHGVLLSRLRRRGWIDWERASVDAAAVAAPRGARPRGPTPRTGARPAASVTWP